MHFKTLANLNDETGAKLMPSRFEKRGDYQETCVGVAKLAIMQRAGLPISRTRQIMLAIGIDSDDFVDSVNEELSFTQPGHFPLSSDTLKTVAGSIDQEVLEEIWPEDRANNN